MTNLDKVIDRYYGRLPLAAHKIDRCADLAMVQEQLHCVQGNILHARGIKRCAKAAAQAINNTVDFDSKYSVY